MLPGQFVVAFQHISAPFGDDPEGSPVSHVKLMVKRSISDRPFVKLDVLIALVFEMNTFKIVAKLVLFTASS
jgi:hypothetical protein